MTYSFKKNENDKAAYENILITKYIYYESDMERPSNCRK